MAPRITLLLPPRTYLVDLVLPERIGRALARALRAQREEAGPHAQLRRHFQWPSHSGSMAALSRQFLCGDADGALWLRADPVSIAADINGARMLAHGESLDITENEAVLLASALKPLFGDAGYAFDIPDVRYWFVRILPGSPLPHFVDIDDVLGCNLLDHLPQGDDAQARHWHGLLTEVQMLLHQHPCNQRRIANGKLPINSLWFWGGGPLPDHVHTDYSEIRSQRLDLLALAQAANVAANLDDTENATKPGNVLVDLRHLRSGHDFIEHVLQPLIDSLRKRQIDALQLDFEDGVHYRLLPNTQRWKFWLRPLTGL